MCIWSCLEEEEHVINYKMKSWNNSNVSFRKMIFIFIIFCCYIVQAEICDDKGESCNACIKANCHFLANKDNTTICLTTQIFNALNFNNNDYLKKLNWTETTEKTKCDDTKDNTNDQKPNGSNSSAQGGHGPNMDNHEKQNSTIKPDIEITTILNTDNDSNNSSHVNVNATTAKTNKETATKPTDNKHENSTTERIKTENKGGFNAGSFIGGIVLVICASLVTFYGVRYYKAYRDGRPFSFRIFNNNHGFAARQDTDDPGFPF